MALIDHYIQQTLTDAGVRPDTVGTLHEGIKYYYSDSRRRYHNLDHILYMMRKMSEWDWDDLNLRLAVLFHDIYYIPGNKPGENEKKSAQMASAVLQNMSRILPDDIVEIYIAIIRTADFMTTQEEPQFVQRLLDLDLSSMARPYDEFHTQQIKIAQEARPNVSGMEALIGCEKFMTMWFERRDQQLFYTPEGKALMPVVLDNLKQLREFIAKESAS